MSSPMHPVWKGKRYRLYYAKRGSFVNPGFTLWTGKRHWLILPTGWPTKEGRDY